jgi:hypothetical protein
LFSTSNEKWQIISIGMPKEEAAQNVVQSCEVKRDRRSSCALSVPQAQNKTQLCTSILSLQVCQQMRTTLPFLILQVA